MKLCLVLLLILGQAALLQHVALHQLEHAISQDQGDDDHCSFCAIGGNTASNALPAPLAHPFEWTKVVFSLPARLHHIGRNARHFEARGPPLPSVA